MAADVAVGNGTTVGHPPLGFWRRRVFSTDHKTIGMQYMVTGLIFGLIGGYLAYVFRGQMVFADKMVPLFGAVDAQAYNTMVTMHGTIMVFWVAMPILLAGFGNFVIPLMVGTDDMAFPTVNMLSYWVFLLSGVVLLASFFVPGGAFDGAWTAYPPYSAGGYIAPKSILTGLGGHMWILAVALEFVAFLMGGINFLVTAINKRAPGMTWFNMPIVLWMLIFAVLIFMFSVGPLIAGAVMLLLDRTIGTGFFNPAAGGDPILWQHLFWFFGHPEVYVLLLPSLGIVAEILPVFSRKPLFGYRIIVYSTFVAAFLSFVVWAHHQFVAGIDPRMSTFFSITTILISIPIAAIIFAYIATLWQGAVQLTTAMLFALGFVAEFLLGGVTGIYLGASATDIYAHDTYFVVAHFHYTLFPITFFGGFAGIYYWYPKFIGRMYNETLGKIHFWLTVIFFNAAFLPLFKLGLMGQHRRVFDYTAFPSMMTDEMLRLRTIATYALIGMLLSQIPFIINVFLSAFKGKKAGKNPWQANTLEWAADSPPPHGNFESYPSIHRGPYEYSVPGREEDWWPQHEKG